MVEAHSREARLRARRGQRMALAAALAAVALWPSGASAVIPAWWGQVGWSATRLGDLLNAGGAAGPGVNADDVEPAMAHGEWKWGLDTGHPVGTHAPARYGAAPAHGAAGTWDNPKQFVAEGAPAARVRKSVATLTADEQWVLDRAFGLQQALPVWDPRGVVAQAAVHGFYCGGGLGHDIHRTWEFLPWHRAFTYYAEKILRKLLADDLAAHPGTYPGGKTAAAQSFALPYWNWAADPNPAGNALPVPAVYQAGNLGLAGIWREHQYTTVHQIMGQNIHQRTEMNRMLAFKSWKAVVGSDNLRGLASSLLHDGTHFNISGIGGNMGSVPGAPRDPIFYAHHNMLDRLWDTWIALGDASHWNHVASPVLAGGIGSVQVDPAQAKAESRSKKSTPFKRTRANPTANAFRNIEYKFVDGDGHWVSVHVRDLLDDQNGLRYRYDNLNFYAP